MPQTELKPEEIEELRDALRRCPEGTFEAAVSYRQSPDIALVPVIVMGIVERFLEPEMRPRLREGDDSIRLIEDLGVDSLTMMEIIILVEETLGVSFDNQELREIRTVGEVKAYMERKISGSDPDQPKAGKSFNFDELVAAMPQQPPFLFLQRARITEEGAEATYRIGGDEFFLRGHFKDNPVLPASILLEALGQLAVLYLIRSETAELEGPTREDSIFFTSCDGIRCHRVCRPGDTLTLKVKPKRIRHPLATFEGTALVKDQKAAFAESITLTFDYQDTATEPEVLATPQVNGSSHPFKEPQPKHAVRGY